MKLTVRATSRSLYDEAVAEYDTEIGELSLTVNDVTSYVCWPKPPQKPTSEGAGKDTGNGCRNHPFAVGDRVVLLSTAAWVDPVFGIVSSWDGGAVYVRWDGSERPSRDVPDNIRHADPVSPNNGCPDTRCSKSAPSRCGRPLCPWYLQMLEPVPEPADDAEGGER